jgi:hypothetical protein
MATLTINGRNVTVDDSFLKLSPEQQNATVDEIAAQLGAAPAASAPPVGGPAAVGDRAAELRAATAALPAQPSLLGSTVAFLNHAATDLPIIGQPLQNATDWALGQTLGRLEGKTPEEFVAQGRAERATNDAANPIAAATGGLAGNTAAMLMLGGAPAGADALGLAGSVGRKMLNSGLANYGIAATNNMVQGQKPMEAAENAVVPGIIGAAVPGIARAAGGAADAIAGLRTAARQNALTNAAIKGAAASQQIKDAASQAFDAATGGNPVILTNGAYSRLLGNIQNATQKFRPNELKSPRAVGLLQHFWQIADEMNAPGSNTAVDMKDLHILRQGANELYANGPNQETKAIGKAMVGQIDSFVNSLKPADIAGARDPSQAARSLMQGISGWARANKVKIIEDAIGKADGYASGFQNGLQRQFKLLVKSDDFKRFSPAEQQAIRTVANGTAKSNALAALGQLGFKFGGGTGHNLVGGTIGNVAVTNALAPFLGPAAAPVAIGATTMIGSAARKAGESAALAQANRAAQVAATPNIPAAVPVRVPQLLSDAIRSAELLGRGGLLQSLGQ